MTAQEFGESQDMMAGVDLQQLMRHGRKLHDQAVFDALAAPVKFVGRLLTKGVAAFTGVGETECAERERATIHS